MAGGDDGLHLYNLTLQKPGSITHAVYGNFSAPKAQEVVIARGKSLELLRPDDETGRVMSILSWECFGTIRSLEVFRLTGGNRDYVIVGSDSGKLTILSYNSDANRFKVVHQETYGKTGCRRIVPGQYLAVDPKGRAVMVGAIEKQKFVYILNRDADAKLIISSPLEAHKSHTLVFDCCGVDVEFDNPTFACLEIDYEDVEEELRRDPSADPMGHKLLTFYELDLGLNHVTRKSAEEVDPGANMLISVPGGADGPGGVLVCAENWIIWQNQDTDEVRAPIPRRTGTPDEKGLLITSFATHKQKDLFFFLAQSELGDIYKITLSYQGDEVHDVHVKYFDTCPVASSICILKTGYMFCASEFGNHYLFTFKGIGDNDSAAETSSLTPYSQHVYFSPRKLTNLQLVDDVDSMAPIIDMKIADLARKDTPQIYCLCGRGPRSSLRVLQHGLSPTEMAVSEIPGNASAVWSVKRHVHDTYHAYIVVAFTNATMVLAIGETVEEVNDSGFLNSVSTIGVCLLGEDILLQIHPRGIRLIRADKRINEWKPPGKKEIVGCSTNNRQVAIALNGGEVVYFELDKYAQLIEVMRKEMGSDVAGLAVAPIAPAQRRAKWLAVACKDATVRVLALDPNNPLAQRTVQMLPGKESLPSSIILQYMGADASQQQLQLYVGMQAGFLIRTVLDEQDGSLQDTRQRFIGTRPVRLFRTSVRGANAVMALSSRSWLAYHFQDRLMQVPFSYETLEYCSHFSSDQCPEGLVSIAGSTLRIITIEQLGDMFNQVTHPLRYTPRAFEVHPVTQNLVIIESDHNAYSETEKKTIQETLKLLEDKSDDMDDEDDLKEDFVGVPKAGPGKWASCIRVFDPNHGYTSHVLELDDNEAAFSMCLCQFASRGPEWFLIVGTAKDYELCPRKFSACFINVYMFTDNFKRVQLVHKTQVHEVPLALEPFNGRLLVGMGKVLRVYDVGARKLLRKCENKNFPHMIKTVHVVANRIYVGDMASGFHFCTYREAEKQIYVFADSPSPHYLTCSALLDTDTVAFGDKFGNFTIQRVIMDEDENSIPTARLGSWLNAAPKKLTPVVNYHVNDVITAIQRVRLQPGGEESIVYSTIMGGIGVFIPFKTKTDVDFFRLLEQHMRKRSKPLLGNDHIRYRSYYQPVKEVVDGDLCEQFTALDPKVQRPIADELVAEAAEVAKNLERLRVGVL